MGKKYDVLEHLTDWLGHEPKDDYCNVPWMKTIAKEWQVDRLRIAELEAERDQLLDKVCADRDFHAKNRAKHTALEDKLRSKCDQWWRTEDPLARIIAREVRALLGNESEGESHVRNLLNREMQ